MKSGDIVYHKATNMKCVIAVEWGDDKFKVTTENGKSEIYYKTELLTEAEWKEKINTVEL